MKQRNQTKYENTTPVNKPSWVFDPNESAKYLLTAIIMIAMCFVSAALSIFFTSDFLMRILFEVCAILACFAAILALFCGVYVWASDRERPKLFYKKNN